VFLAGNAFDGRKFPVIALSAANATQGVTFVRRDPPMFPDEAGFVMPQGPQRSLAFTPASVKIWQTGASNDAALACLVIAASV
jgi:hypothetical protein